MSTETATQIPLVARPAKTYDDLGDLLPESTKRRLNRDQVFVVVEAERVVGVSIIWYAGHDIMMVGATRFVESPRRPWYIRELWRTVMHFAAKHGVSEILHSAGTKECTDAFVRLGGVPVRHDDTVLSVTVAKAREPDVALEGPVAPEAIAYRFVSASDPKERQRLDLLRITSKARFPKQPWPWDATFPILGAWKDDRLVGYVQYSVGPGMTWQYGMRVAPDLRGQGLGTRLFAAWLHLAVRMGAEVAVGCAEPENTATRALFTLAGFEERGVLPLIGEVLYVGEKSVFEWATAQIPAGLEASAWV